MFLRNKYRQSILKSLWYTSATINWN